MGTYYIPRNYKGETRFLYIFTIKSLITTAIGAAVGSIFLLIFSVLQMKMIGMIIMAVFAVIGYMIGAIKIPTIVSIPITKKIGGEPLSEIIIRYIKFKKTRKMYSYTVTKEEK
jgi:hypothetical protein